MFVCLCAWLTYLTSINPHTHTHIHKDRHAAVTDDLAMEEPSPPSASASLTGSKALQQMRIPTPPTAPAAPPSSPPARTSEELRAEVAALRRRLAEVEARRGRVRRRRERVESQRQELRAWAAAWWGRVNAQAAALGVQRAALQSAAREAERRRERLRTLARTHVLDDAFFIWHAGPFVTLNGLKLGRLPAIYNVRCCGRSIDWLFGCLVARYADGPRLSHPHIHAQVEWAEVNGALGLAVLVVVTVAERSGYRFRQHQLLPMGSFAKVGAAPPAPAPGPAPAGRGPAPPSSSSSLSMAAAAPAGNSASAPAPAPVPASASASASASGLGTAALSNLYYEEGLAFFRRQGFNRALQAFLRCVHELGELAEQQDPTLRLPYRITTTQEAGAGARGAATPMVGGLPIVLSPGSEETWTRALKYLLTDVKWLVAWSAKHCCCP